MNILKQLSQQLKQVLEILEFSQTAPDIELIGDEKFGDLTTNVAMVLFSQSKSATDNFQAKFSSPRQLAELIVEQLKAQIYDANSANSQTRNPELAKSIDSISIAGPGFINFTLSEHFLLSLLDQDKPQMAESLKEFDTSLSQSRIIIEFTDPNPFKEFHLGHLYSNIVGESLARLFEAVGADVRRACYQGDVGMHVAKSIYGMMVKLQVTLRQAQAKAGDKLQATSYKPQTDQAKQLLDDLEKKPLKERVKLLGEAYALGSRAFADDETAKEEIKVLNAHIFAAAQARMVDEENWQPQIDYTQIANIDPVKLELVDLFYRAGRRWSLEAFEQIYQRLGTKFEAYYFESVMSEYGYQIVKANLGPIFKDSDGAVIFPGSEYGLHDRVFINSLGLPTYEAKELGLAPKKARDWEYDRSFIVTGNEINEYFKVLLKAMSLTHPDLAAKTHHLGHGMLRLPEGKMSSRTGNVLTGETILDEAKLRVMDIFNETQPNLNSDQQEIVAEQVGQAAIKYALLKANVGSDVIFNFEQSINFNGNSGPYVQYTFARAISVLRRANPQFSISNFQTSPNEQDSNNSNGHKILDQVLEILGQIDWQSLGVQMNDEERSVLRYLWKLDLVVARAASEFAPHYVATYVYELAQLFNAFYNKHSILGGAQNEIPNSKLQISSNLQQGTRNKLQDVDFETTVLFRLALTAQVAMSLEQGLRLLGIEAPERM